MPISVEFPSCVQLLHHSYKILRKFYTQEGYRVSSLRQTAPQRRLDKCKQHQDQKPVQLDKTCRLSHLQFCQRFSVPNWHFWEIISRPITQHHMDTPCYVDAYLTQVEFPSTNPQFMPLLKKTSVLYSGRKWVSRSWKPLVHDRQPPEKTPQRRPPEKTPREDPQRNSYINAIWRSGDCGMFIEMTSAPSNLDPLRPCP